MCLVDVRVSNSFSRCVNEVYCIQNPVYIRTQVQKSDDGSYRIRSDPKTAKNPIGIRVAEFRSDPTIGYAYVSDKFRLLKFPSILTVGFRSDFHRILSISQSVVDLIYHDNVWNPTFDVCESESLTNCSH